MSETLYVRQGSNYYPVAEYNNAVVDSLRKGDYLISVRSGVTTRSKIDPAFVLMAAAARYGGDAIATAIRSATDMRPGCSELTPDQQSAWTELNRTLGESSHAMIWPAVVDGVDAAEMEMLNQAQALLANPSIKLAYEEFMLVCKLVNSNNIVDSYPNLL